MKKTLFIFLVLFLLILPGGVLFATDYSSASYTVKDPVLEPAGYATSPSYSLTSTIGQIAIGTSTAASGVVRQTLSGFEYYPFVSIPTLSGTAGSAQVSLSWTSAVGALGWTVSGYSVGQSAVSGGPYSYTAVGFVTGTTVLSLTNGATYYFVVRPTDAFGNTIATSNEISATPVAGAPAPTPTPTPANASGGGVFIIPVRPPLVIPPLRPVSTTTPKTNCHSIADLNCDGFVDIIDFSIMYHWYGEADVPARVDLAPDGVIDISDFSVMAFYWYEAGD